MVVCLLDFFKGRSILALSINRHSLFGEFSKDCLHICNELGRHGHCNLSSCFDDVILSQGCRFNVESVELIARRTELLPSKETRLLRQFDIKVARLGNDFSDSIFKESGYLGNVESICIAALSF